MVEKSQDIEMDKSVAVGNVENNSENIVPKHGFMVYSSNRLKKLKYQGGSSPKFTIQYLHTSQGFGKLDIDFKIEL